jgi:2,4-dienoyl-CoA reductase-like NADH-dependent reductase (Old Yellow Enzyme family)
MNHVFTPLALNRLRTRNRIFVPAHTTNFGVHHLPSDRHVAYHRARARGGAAVVIFEAIRVMENTLGRPQGVAGYAPECVPLYRKVADAVHEEGALFFAQICHMGRQIEGEFERTCSYGPSPIRWAMSAYPPREMSRADMQAVIDGHLRTAENMLAAGADGIELHWGHGHLLQQFLSPLSNQRTDDFGGSTERRLRFPLEVAQRLRALVGPDVCLGVRFSAEEFVEGGLTLDEAVRIMRHAVGQVQLDFVHVSHSAYHMSRSLGTQMADMGVDKAMFRGLPGAIREAVRAAPKPVAILTVCKYRDLDEADRMIANGAADMVGMARAHVADPAIVRKTQEGRVDEIRPCIGCNQGCAQNLEKNIALTCLVNPAAGREAAWPEVATRRTSDPRRILVVGGGPAGLEAAGSAAEIGHRVELWERAPTLGGRLALAAGLRLREDFGLWLGYAEKRLARTGVVVKTGTIATVPAIAAGGFDEVILATGATPAAMTLPDGTTALTLDAAAQADFAGKAVAVYDETGDWGVLGLVEHLAECGARVTLVTPAAGALWRTTIYSNTLTFSRWREKRIRIRTLRKPRSFAGGRLVLEDTSCGETETLEGIDAVVACGPAVAHYPLEAALAAAGIRAKVIGDALAPRNALEAVFDGHRAAREAGARAVAAAA